MWNTVGNKPVAVINYFYDEINIYVDVTLKKIPHYFHRFDISWRNSNNLRSWSINLIFCIEWMKIWKKIFIKYLMKCCRNSIIHFIYLLLFIVSKISKIANRVKRVQKSKQAHIFAFLLNTKVSSFDKLSLSFIIFRT